VEDERVAVMVVGLNDVVVGEFVGIPALVDDEPTEVLDDEDSTGTVVTKAAPHATGLSVLYESVALFMKHGDIAPPLGR